MSHPTYEAMIDGLDVQGDLTNYFWNDFDGCFETTWDAHVFCGPHMIELDAFPADFEERAKEALDEQAEDDMSAGMRDAAGRKWL